MNGAIFFSGKYGSTEQYANWIVEATGFSVFDIKDPNADPSKYKFDFLGSSILYFKLSIRKWTRVNLSKLMCRSKILFSSSGAGKSPKLNKCVSHSFPSTLFSQVEHVALRGRLDHSKLNWLLRKILWVGSLIYLDSEAIKDERYGFDYVEKESIEPILKQVRLLKNNELLI